jgi:hypothetical protein
MKTLGDLLTELQKLSPQQLAMPAPWYPAPQRVVQPYEPAPEPAFPGRTGTPSPAALAALQPDEIAWARIITDGITRVLTEQYDASSTWAVRVQQRDLYDSLRTPQPKRWSAINNLVKSHFSVHGWSVELEHDQREGDIYVVRPAR